MKNSNFKKVLALVLSLAMVLSVCLTGFAVSAETAEVDLSYCIVNDTTMKTWRSGNQAMALVNYDGKTLYRIAPKNAATGQFGISSKAELTAEQAASVNTLSYYIANETGVALPINYKYYANDGSDVANFSGYVYLVSETSGEIVPLLAEGAYFNVPAGFKGYVVYDLSKSDNYGNSNVKNDSDELISTVDIIKEKLFKPMCFFPKYTEAMITKAWYVGDLAVSTKTVEELAKYISGDEIISYNFNMANDKSLEGDESVTYWGNKFDNDGAEDRNAYSRIVDYDDGLDSHGAQFDYVVLEGANIGRIDIRDSFRASRGTDLPFAIDKAVGFKYDVTIEGAVPFAYLIGGEGNTINGTYYYVYEDGTVVTGVGSLPQDFKGTVYCVFDDKAVKGTTSWADFVNVNLKDKEFNMAMYSGNTGIVGSKITFGGFGLIYDAAPVTAAFEPEATNNPVIFDGNENPMKWGSAGWGTAAYYSNFSVANGKEFTAVCTNSSGSKWLAINNEGKAVALTDVDKINGFSIKIKVPADGATHKLSFYANTINERPFRGLLTAIDGYGNVVSTVDAVLTSGMSTVSLPSGFDGIVIIHTAGEGAFSKSYGKTTFASYADFYADSKFSGFNLNFSSTGSYVVGETTYVYDDLTVIYDTVDDYIAAYKASCPEAASYMIYDGTKATRNPYAKDWDISYGDHYTAVYNANPTSTSLNNFIRFDDNAVKTLNFDVTKVKGWVFEFKAPDDGYTHQFTMNMQWENADVYRGLMYAIDKSGNTVASRSYRWDGGISLKLPSGFDGYVVLKDDVNQGDAGAYIKGYVGGENMTGYKTFAEFYEVRAGLYGFTFRMGKRLDSTNTAVDFVAGVTYEYDDMQAITQDVDTYMTNLKASLAAEAAAEAEKVMNSDGYLVNDFSGVNGNTANSPWTGGNTNNVDVTMVDGKGKVVFNASHPEGNQRDHNMKIVNTAGVDLSKSVGFTYRVDMENPDNVSVNWWYKLNNEATYVKKATIYAISDSGEITKFDNLATFKTEFHGQIVVLLNEGLMIGVNYSNTPTYTWSDWIKEYGLVDIRPWFGAPSGVPEMTEAVIDETTGEVITPATLTGGYANFAMYYDDLEFIGSESSIVKAINAEEAKENEKLKTDKYYNTASDISTLGVYSSVTTIKSEDAPYDVVVDEVDALATGTAFKFTRNANEYKSGRQLFVGGRSSLTNEEVLALDAIAFWVKVPEGQSIDLSRNISCQKANVHSSTMTYDTVKKEFKMYEKADYTALSGFEGYIIIPIKNALVATGWSNANILPLSEAFGTNYGDGGNLTKLGGYFYFGNEIANQASEFWLGSFQTIPSLTQFFAEIGAETVAGDANGDGEVDIRDTVRIKKYNADSKTAVAYQNMDIDGNGLIETSIDMAASRKQNLGVKFEAPELDYSLVKTPDVMVGFYHGDYGVWDYYTEDIAPESDVLNTYTSFDMYSLAQMKQNGGSAWMYISKSFAGEPVFGTKDGGYDNAATEINEAWKTALDDAINEYKAKGVWNQIVGFHTEEVLMNVAKYMSQTQYATMTKYLRDTYGKRVLAVLSTYEVNGNPDFKIGDVVTPIPAATPETYANVTDIGYDMYNITDDERKESFTSIFNNMKANIGNRTDVKYWLLPTAYCGKTAEGAPARTDESIAAEIAWFDDFFANTDLIPESQRGGILFYTFRTFYDGGFDYPVSAGNFGSFGLDKLMSEYNYTLTAKAIADMAAKYVK